jgi:hypothetical protein
MNRSIEARISKLEGSRRRGAELTEAEIQRMTDAEVAGEIERLIDEAGGPEAAFWELAAEVGKQKAAELMGELMCTVRAAGRPPVAIGGRD